MSRKKGFGKLLAGLAIGAGLGMLFAPKKGSEMRKDLKVKIDELIQNAKEIDVEEVKEKIQAKALEINVLVSELDKEKTIKIAKQKAKQIQDMGEELVKYAIASGTPVLQKMAEKVRVKAIDVAKEVLERLEKKDK